ncbi:MAG: sensor histidine kinase [Terriglobales bacterium]|jgi:two-component system sensor histidine kinase DesK
MNLLPRKLEHGWAPYVWLSYFIFFFIDPIVGHAGWKQWALTVLGTFLFLGLYFTFFWVGCRGKLWVVAGILALGIAYAPFNGGASTLFIFACAFIPFAVETEGRAVVLLLAIAAVGALEWKLLHINNWFLFYACGLSLAIGGSNVFFAQRDRSLVKLRQAQDQIEHLAKVAERERIARDLHDVLGHTLSVIILKSELAGKLIERDPARAKAEIADVEQTSRAALAEVRSTIRGYRAHSLDAEIKNARATLETAGVAVNTDATEVSLTPAQESVVALVVREAVTNVVRHADARNCQLRLAPLDGTCLLEIQDDGRGGSQEEGNGLRGMRERIEALGGTFRRETNPGTRLVIQFPLQPAKANGAL